MIKSYFCNKQIGDFAVLRRAGVSMKTAVIFNIVSSIFCFIGVIVGVLVGGIQKLNSWSFLFIAGTFIYISLVDIVSYLI
jgi:zinc transporter 10